MAVEEHQAVISFTRVIERTHERSQPAYAKQAPRQ
jgi:hypothetical protein